MRRMSAWRALMLSTLPKRTRGYREMGFCLAANSTNRWPKGVVPYQIDGAVFPAGSAGRQQVLLAINAWNTTSIVKLRPTTASDADFINITSSSDTKACSSSLGRQGGSQQVACI